MTRRHLFLALPALALGCLLLLPEVSHAQFRGWRGGGFGGTGFGNFGNFGNAGTMYGPGWGSWGGLNGYSGFGNSGYNPYGWNNYNVFTPMQQGYSAQPAFGVYGQPYVDTTNTGFANVVPSGNYQNYQSFYPSSTTMSNDRAHIHVQVPANAQVMFNNTPTQQTGTQRNFISPPLQPNFKYSYQISANWKDNNGKEHHANRAVQLRPGQTVDVNFLAGANNDSGNVNNPNNRNQNNTTPRPASPFEDSNDQPSRNPSNLNQNAPNPNANPQAPNQNTTPRRNPSNVNPNLPNANPQVPNPNTTQPRNPSNETPR